MSDESLPTLSTPMVQNPRTISYGTHTNKVIRVTQQKLMGKQQKAGNFSKSKKTRKQLKKQQTAANITIKKKTRKPLAPLSNNNNWMDGIESDEVPTTEPPSISGISLMSITDLKKQINEHQNSLVLFVFFSNFEIILCFFSNFEKIHVFFSNFEIN